MKYNVGKFFELFESHILKRGYNYFLENKISTMETIDDLKFRFFVEGTENYEVEIVLNESGVHSMSCDCPYAELENCKHMAAALYALKEGVEIKKHILNEVIELSDFDSFKLNVLDSLTTHSYSEFYDDYEYDSKVVTISNYGIDEVSNIIGSGNYDFAMQAILYLYELCLVDSEEEEIHNADEYIAKLNNLLSIIITVENVYNVLTKLIAFDNSYRFENIISCVCKAANNNELNDRVINIIEGFSDLELDTYEKNSIIFKILLPNDLEKAKEMLFRYKQEEMLAEILDYLEGDLLESIDIIERFYDYGVYEYEHFYEYINMCHKAGLENKYYSSLMGHVMDKGSFRSYEYLMKTSSFERYKKDLEEAIMRKGDIYDKINLCLLYKQYDHLLGLCKNRFHLIEQYFDLLKSDYGKELIEIYRGRIIMLCKGDACKHNYKLISRFILRIAQVQDSKEDVTEIIDYIKINYKRRIRLIEELEFIEATVL